MKENTDTLWIFLKGTSIYIDQPFALALELTSEKTEYF